VRLHITFSFAMQTAQPLHPTMENTCTFRGVAVLCDLLTALPPLAPMVLHALTPIDDALMFAAGRGSPLFDRLLTGTQRWRAVVSINAVGSRCCIWTSGLRGAPAASWCGAETHVSGMRSPRQQRSPAPTAAALRAACGYRSASNGRESRAVRVASHNGPLLRDENAFGNGT
jgi:hypothetical protein